MKLFFFANRYDCRGSAANVPKIVMRKISERIDKTTLQNSELNLWSLYLIWSLIKKHCLQSPFFYSMEPFERYRRVEIRKTPVNIIVMKLMDILDFDSTEWMKVFMISYIKMPDFYFFWVFEFPIELSAVSRR